MIITIANVNDAMPILIRDNNTFEKLKTDFPDILADLVTFKNNPNCSCRGRVVKFFIEKLEQDSNLLDKYITDIVGLQKELASIQAARMANNYAGRIFVIDKGEAAWQAFSASLIGKAFRTFSVVEKEDSVVVYLL